MKKWIALLALVAATLDGCAFSSVQAPPPPVSGGKSATFVLDSLAKTPSNSRPSGTLGIFTSLYLAQRLFLSTQSATKGIGEIMHIVRTQEQPLENETFALLQTLGDTLSVNIVDLLNRSATRLETLDQYVRVLRNTTENSRQRNEELSAALETIAARKKEERQLVRDIERAKNDAVNARDFSTAGAKEEELVKAQTALSQTELEETQTKTVQKQLTNYLDLAQKRLSAIEQNREILLSGLSITDTQGLKDLGLVRESAQ